MVNPIDQSGTFRHQRRHHGDQQPHAVFEEQRRRQAERDAALELAPVLAPMVADVPHSLYEAHRTGQSILFEGAQGSLLDIDHGTYPFVTSSNCVAGAAAAGAGVGPAMLHYVLGITKAYTTRVGSGPFPTELEDAMGEHLRERGNEFGATTGRPRRCGWLDLVVLDQSIGDAQNPRQ